MTTTPSQPGAATHMHPVAVISMLHEPATAHSATRTFRGKPVLAWTLDRLSRARNGAGRPIPVAIATWDDQRAAVAAALGGSEFLHLAAGTRAAQPAIDAVATAQRWADGWRSGLLGTCWFDRGFNAPIVATALTHFSADAALLIDPAAGLVDPEFVSALVAHADANADRAFVFSPAAPGLSGALLRRELVSDLVKLGTHPGRALHYVPDQYAHDPIATPAAVPTPTSAARSLRRFTLDTDAQLRTLDRATASLNGTLATTPAEPLVALLGADTELADLPRDLRLELTTRRNTRPVFVPAGIERAELSTQAWLPLLDQIAPASREPFHAGTRLTLAGLGDPLLHPGVLSLINAAAARGIPVSLETDLIGVAPDLVAALAATPLDVLVVHLPAATVRTYAQVMGVDALGEAFSNIAKFVEARQRAARATPLVVPTFTKLASNLPEMEAWYDHYLRTFGSAVIEPPQLAPHLAAADMSPPNRIPCRRLSSRLQVLSDGSVAQCDLALAGAAPTIGSVLVTPLRDLWRGGLEPLRRWHAASSFSLNVLCSSCTEWHRP